MGKWCIHASLFIFDQIIIRVAGNRDRHKSSDKFDFGLLDQNSGVHGNRKPPLTNNGENGVSVALIQSFLYLQVTRTCIKSWTRLNFSQIGPLTTELAALERLKIFP